MGQNTKYKFILKQTFMIHDSGDINKHMYVCISEILFFCRWSFISPSIALRDKDDHNGPRFKKTQ